MATEIHMIDTETGEKTDTTLEALCAGDDGIAELRDDIEAAFTKLPGVPYYIGGGAAPLVEIWKRLS